MVEGRIRKSLIAGTWYPGDREVLRATIEGYMRNVSSGAPEGTVVSLVSPHAGYMYSGQVAAYAYHSIRGQAYDAVVVVGPSHRAAFRGISIYGEGGYETPLGVVPVDTALAERIRSATTCVVSSPQYHDGEHAIEIQLPFLQLVLEEVSFVPIMLGQQDRETCQDVARSIVEAAEGLNVLVVASSDLSHYHPYDEAVEMDAVVLKYIEKKDPEGLLRALQRHDGEACGGGPIAVAMMAADRLGAEKAIVLKYLNSGDVVGDKSGVVGYAAAACFRGKER